MVLQVWSRYMNIIDKDGMTDADIEKLQENVCLEQVERVDPVIVLGIDRDIGLQCRECHAF